MNKPENLTHGIDTQTSGTISVEFIRDSVSPKIIDPLKIEILSGNRLSGVSDTSNSEILRIGHKGILRARITKSTGIAIAMDLTTTFNQQTPKEY